MRCVRSSIHAASGLSDGYATASHIAGTWLLKSDVAIASSSADITTSPLSAFNTSESDRMKMLISLLYRMHSCASTVFIDSVVRQRVLLGDLVHRERLQPALLQRARHVADDVVAALAAAARHAAGGRA